MVLSKLDRVLCRYSKNSKDCVDSAQGVLREFQRRNIAISEDPAEVDGVDAVVIFGGDGFLMESLRELDYPEAPIFGVNFGTVGFLMNSQSSADQLPDILLQPDLISVSYRLLRAEVVLESGESLRSLAFNEFVLERQTGQAVHLEVSVDGHMFNRFAGDGLIVSTAAGSTAYNLAAGGPAVHPDVEGVIMTPLYPHQAEPFHPVQFSLMLPRRSRITVQCEDSSKRHMRLVADGRPLRDVSRVEITDADRKVTVLRTPDRRFTSLLLSKVIGGPSLGG